MGTQVVSYSGCVLPTSSIGIESTQELAQTVCYVRATQLLPLLMSCQDVPSASWGYSSNRERSGAIDGVLQTSRTRFAAIWGLCRLSGCSVRLQGCLPQLRRLCRLPSVRNEIQSFARKVFFKLSVPQSPTELWPSGPAFSTARGSVQDFSVC